MDRGHKENEQVVITKMTAVLLKYQDFCKLIVWNWFLSPLHTNRGIDIKWRQLDQINHYGYSYKYGDFHNNRLVNIVVDNIKCKKSPFSLFTTILTMWSLWIWPIWLKDKILGQFFNFLIYLFFNLFKFFFFAHTHIVDRGHKENDQVVIIKMTAVL